MEPKEVVSSLQGTGAFRAAALINSKLLQVLSMAWDRHVVAVCNVHGAGEGGFFAGTNGLHILALGRCKMNPEWAKSMHWR